MKIRYAESWSSVNIEHLNFEDILVWCSNNLKGKQFIEGNIIKFSSMNDAEKFTLEYIENKPA